MSFNLGSWIGDAAGSLSGVLESAAPFVDLYGDIRQATGGKKKRAKQDLQPGQVPTAQEVSAAQTADVPARAGPTAKNYVPILVAAAVVVGAVLLLRKK